VEAVDAILTRMERTVVIHHAVQESLAAATPFVWMR
jgi:hypothetical protein